MSSKPTPSASTNSTELSIDEALLNRYDGKIPAHLAIIMDGNGRWAQQRNMMRLKGHQAGANSVRRVVESCRFLGVEIVTLYAFSSQNWQRPGGEVSGLMTLFDHYIKRERQRLIANGIRLIVLGDRSRLSTALQRAIADLEESSAANDAMLLQVAVSYGGREEILHATRQIAHKIQTGTLTVDSIDEELFADHLYTRRRRDPDLVIRTSGEYRISNFLLWQIAYSELHITDTLWPDFDEASLIDAFSDFSRRQRRFGQTTEQVSP